MGVFNDFTFFSFRLQHGVVALDTIWFGCYQVALLLLDAIVATLNEIGY